MERGEGKQLLEQIRELSSDLMKSLKDIDGRLAVMQESIGSNDNLNRQELLEQVSEIRNKIGAMEKEDTEEMEDEEILENMISKLSKLIEMTLD